MRRLFLASSPDGACSCLRRLISRLPCLSGGSSVACEQEVTLVYLRVNNIRISAALDLGSA